VGIRSGIWGYSLAWFAFNDQVKVRLWHMIRQGGERQERHIGRVRESMR
jgi:hypothetical protein